MHQFLDLQNLGFLQLTHQHQSHNQPSEFAIGIEE